MRWIFIVGPWLGFALMAWAACRAAHDGDQVDVEPEGSRTPDAAHIGFCGICDDEVVWDEDARRAVCRCGATSLPLSLVECELAWELPAAVERTR